MSCTEHYWDWAHRSTFMLPTINIKYQNTICHTDLSYPDLLERWLSNPAPSGDFRQCESIEQKPESFQSSLIRLRTKIYLRVKTCRLYFLILPPFIQTFLFSEIKIYKQKCNNKMFEEQYLCSSTSRYPFFLIRLTFDSKL